VSHRDPVTWPQTLDAAVDALLDRLGEDGRRQLAEAPREALAGFHHSLGMALRNEFGLWQGNTALLSDCGSAKMHPDDASGVIIRAAWGKLHGQPVGDARLPNYRPLGEVMRELGPEEFYRRYSPRLHEQQVYKLMRLFFRLDFKQFKAIAARA
jgi:hypothetical protein